MKEPTFLWYDLETFGIDPHYDRIAQFAAIRTTMDFQIVAEPIVLYCRLTDDYLPDPLASLVTGITPDVVQSKGMCEAEFAKVIFEEFTKPGSCIVGYNSIHFDDEFIRNLFYRNFFDPYVREYASGNSRWDMINCMRAAHDLRPDGFNWPKNEKNRTSFRLEELTKANGISHEDAHDALADVYATISVARHLKENQQELFTFAFNHRQKRALKNLVNLHDRQPFLHTAGIHTNDHGCTALMLPLAADPQNSNSVLCYDLSKDPRELIEASVEQLSGGPILTKIALNACPFISPVSVLTDQVAFRLGIDKQRCREHYRQLISRSDLAGKIHAACSLPYPQGVEDPDFQIYSGGFFSDADRERFSLLRSERPEKLLSLPLKFEDRRVPTMLWRYVARNYPEVLGEEDMQKWKNFCATRLLFPPGKIMISHQFYMRKISEKASSQQSSVRDKLILQKLQEYGRELEERVIHQL